MATSLTLTVTGGPVDETLSSAAISMGGHVSAQCVSAEVFEKGRANGGRQNLVLQIGLQFSCGLRTVPNAQG
jgi:hypothetical protein